MISTSIYRFIRPIVTDIGSVPASCPSWMRRIAGGGRTKGVKCLSRIITVCVNDRLLVFLCVCLFPSICIFVYLFASPFVS